MKKTYLILLFISLSCVLRSQVTRDSLDKLFTQIKYEHVNFDRSFELSRKILAISQNNQDTLYIIKSFQKIGDLLWYNGAYSRSEDYYLKSLNIVDSLKHPKEYAYALYSIGWIECVQKKKEDRVYLLKKSFKVYQNLKDTMGIVSVLNALSAVYSTMAEKKQLKIAYIDSSITYLQKAIAICLNNKKLRNEICNLYSNIAEQYLIKKDYVNATIYVNKALAETSLEHNKRVFGQSLVTKGKIFYFQGQLDSCIDIILSHIDVVEEYSFDAAQKEAYFYLYKCYKKKHNMSLALHYFEKYNEINDEINKELLSVQYEEVEANYKIIKKEKEISELVKQNELYQLKGKQRLYILVGACVVILLISTFLFNMIKQNKRIKKLSNNISIQKALIEEKHKEINDSITYAKRIQEAILPSRYSLLENLKNGFILFQPKDIVSGDFYWLEKVGKQVFFAAADCTGHGVPGAMVSVVCANAISKALLEEGITETGKLLDRTRELVIERFENSDEDVKDGMDISLCKLDGNKLQWSGANNPIWLIRKNSKEVEEIKPDKQPIGKVDNSRSFTTHNIELQTGDSIYIFTDGYADQFGGEKGKKLMYKPLKDLLLSLQEFNMDEQKEKIGQYFHEWKGTHEQVDDVCIIGVSV